MTLKQKQTDSSIVADSSAAQVMGLHAVIECRGEISKYNCDELALLLKRMAKAAGATVLGENFHDFGAGLGNTGVLLLAESHISVHSWPETDYAAIDIFVCGDASKTNMEPVEAAINVLRSADGHGCLTFQILERAVPQSSKIKALGVADVSGLENAVINDKCSS